MCIHDKPSVKKIYNNEGSHNLAAKFMKSAASIMSQNVLCLPSLFHGSLLPFNFTVSA